MEAANITQAVELLKQAKPLFECGNQYLVAGVGILGAVLGALATYFPTLWHEKRQRDHLKQSVAAQIYAEIRATLQLEKHRGYIHGIQEIIALFDRGEIKTATYQVQVSAERYPIYRANIQNLALLGTELQTKIVTLYQLAEAVIQDIKPGGLLNAKEVGRKPFAELLEILLSIRKLADEVLAELEAKYISS